MRATFQNTGTALTIGVFFSLMIAGLAGTLPTTLTSGLQAHGIAHQIGTLPPMSSLFAAVLGENPCRICWRRVASFAHFRPRPVRRSPVGSSSRA